MADEIKAVFQLEGCRVGRFGSAVAGIALVSAVFDEFVVDDDGFVECFGHEEEPVVVGAELMVFGEGKGFVQNGAPETHAAA